MIPFDAPFIPDEPADRLNPDGSRNCEGLGTPIIEHGKVIGYEVNF